MEFQMIQRSVLGLGLCAGLAMAQEMVDEGKWALIGDPGNRHATDEEMPWDISIQIGAVDYLYRISKLEVTNGEYLEFVEAYTPIYFKNHPELFRAHEEFSGWNLVVTRVHIGLIGTDLNRAANMGWEYAARYVNWLHHGKLSDEWAFETGVFDTSTFKQIDGIPWEPQPVHSPAARYWIPTEHEWTKAAYWDPNKNGEGVGGYWWYPNGTNLALPIDIMPEDGGVRNGGHLEFGFPLSVGSFPETLSPWGVQDLSGGEWEWAERHNPNPVFHLRVFTGSVWFDTLYNEPYTPGIYDLDRLGYLGGTGVVDPHGLRLATTPTSPVDFNQDGYLNFFDISVYISMFIVGDERADLRLDGVFDIDDVRVFLGLWTSR